MYCPALRFCLLFAATSGGGEGGSEREAHVNKEAAPQSIMSRAAKYLTENRILMQAFAKNVQVGEFLQKHS